jgi:hypothetical protein
VQEAEKLSLEEIRRHALLDILGNSHDEVVHLDARIEGWLGFISGGFLVRPRFQRLDELRAEMVIARRLTNASVLASDISNV